MKQFSTGHIGRKGKKRTQALGLTQWVEFLLHKSWIRGSQEREKKHGLGGKTPPLWLDTVVRRLFSQIENRTQYTALGLSRNSWLSLQAPHNFSRFWSHLISWPSDEEWSVHKAKWGYRRTVDSVICDSDGGDSDGDMTRMGVIIMHAVLCVPHIRSGHFSLCTSSRRTCSS